MEVETKTLSMVIRMSVKITLAMWTIQGTHANGTRRLVNAKKQHLHLMQLESRPLKHVVLAQADPSAYGSYYPQHERNFWIRFNDTYRDFLFASVCSRA